MAQIYQPITKLQQLFHYLHHGGLIELYQACFADPPYYEDFSTQEVESFFHDYLQHGVIVICNDEKDQVLGFATAVPLRCEVELSTLLKRHGFNPRQDWYFADLGTAQSHRRQGIAESLVRQLITLTPYQ